MIEEEIRSKLRRWIAERSKSKFAVELKDNTLILDEGILSSLDIVELVLFIESLKGVELDTDEIEPEFFASVDSLYGAFFSRASNPSQPLEMGRAEPVSDEPPNAGSLPRTTYAPRQDGVRSGPSRPEGRG